MAKHHKRRGRPDELASGPRLMTHSSDGLGLLPRFVITIWPCGRKDWLNHCKRFHCLPKAVQWLDRFDGQEPYVYEVAVEPAVLKRIVGHAAVRESGIAMDVRVGVIARGAGKKKQKPGKRKRKRVPLPADSRPFPGPSAESMDQIDRTVETNVQPPQ
jgi:hypothetical protein